MPPECFVKYTSDVHSMPFDGASASAPACCGRITALAGLADAIKVKSRGLACSSSHRTYLPMQGTLKRPASSVVNITASSDADG